MKRKNKDSRKTERDNLLFNGVCVGTLLKNHAERQVSIYNHLNNKEKPVVSLCQNSIIDLSDETNDSQRRFFSDEQWKDTKKTYSNKFKYNNTSEYPNKLKIIDTILRKTGLDGRYKKVREL